MLGGVSTQRMPLPSAMDGDLTIPVCPLIDKLSSSLCRKSSKGRQVSIAKKFSAEKL